MEQFGITGSLSIFLFIAFFIFLAFINISAVRKAKLEIKNKKKEVEEQFLSIEKAIGAITGDWLFFLYNDQGFWSAVEYPVFRKEVLDSFDVEIDSQSDYGLVGREIAYRIDQARNKVYLNATSRYSDANAIDWNNRIEFDEWAKKETDVDRAIENYKEKQKFVRQGRPKPKWWQFWLVD